MSVNPKPTDAEVDILSVLWENGASTVKTVHDILSKKKDVVYTTTLKMMQNMFDKGYLSREKEGRSHVYAPLLSERDTKSFFLEKIKNTLFGGSAVGLVTQAIGNGRASKEELEAIRKLLDSLEGGKK